MKKLSIMILLLLWSVSCFCYEIEKFLPLDSHVNLTVIQNKDLFLKYDYSKGCPVYVLYVLNKDKLVQNTERKGMQFTVDPIAHSMDTKVYIGSGYDRGHMCPAEDMSYSRYSMLFTFYTSNICPQDPNMNKGVWKELEEYIRHKAQTDEYIVLTAPVFGLDCPRIKNRVTVPSGLVKVIYNTRTKVVECYYIYNREQRGKVFTSFKTTLLEVEKLLDFDLSKYKE